MINNKSLKINAVLNVMKQCCGIIFPLIIYPFVTRRLGASTLGRYSFAESIVNYFCLVASLGIPTYAIREGSRIRNDKVKVERFCTEVFTINVIASIFSYILMIGSIFIVPRLQRESILIGIISTNIIWGVVGREWINTIYEDFLYITIRYVFFQVVALILILIFIRNPSDYKKYTMIMVFSSGFCTNIANVFYTQRYVRFSITKKINLKTHMKPILYLFCTSIAITIYIKSDITILGFLRSDEEVGIYTVSSRIYSLIKSVLNAIIMVTIPRISNYLGDNQIKEYKSMLNLLQKVLIILVCPCVVGLFCLSDEIICLIGGMEFHTGYISLRILCVALFLAVFGCFYANTVLVVNRKEKFFFISTIVSATVNILLNIIMIPYWGINGAAFTTVIAELLVLIICKNCSKPYIDIHDDGNSISVILGSLTIVIVCVIVKYFVKLLILKIVISVVISMLTYLGILAIMKNTVFMKILWYVRDILKMKK